MATSTISATSDMHINFGEDDYIVDAQNHSLTLHFDFSPAELIANLTNAEREIAGVTLPAYTILGPSGQTITLLNLPNHLRLETTSYNDQIITDKQLWVDLRGGDDLIQQLNANQRIYLVDPYNHLADFEIDSENNAITYSYNSELHSVLYGGDFTLVAGNLADTVFGSPLNDQISGNEDNDSLIGALGNDTLDGGSGNDLLIGDDALTAYTFNAILTQNDENWTATSLERVDLTLYLEQEQPFTYSYGDPYSFPGGQVVQMLVNNGTLYDHISFNGYNDSFQANTPLISQFTTKSEENYIILEIPFEMDGVKQNLLFELYSEGSYFDSVQTLDDWFSDAQRKSQGIPVITNYQAGSSLGLADSTSGQLIDGSNITGKLGGNDSLVGGDGDDTIIGGPGHDILIGGAGNDLLNDGLGNDTIDGGDGIDTYTRNFSEETNYIWKVGIDLENGYIFHAETNEIGDPLLNIENLYLPGSLDKKIVGSSDDNEIITGAGNDTIHSGGGNDTIDLGSGDDLVYLGHGSSIVEGGFGHDVGVVGGRSDDYLLTVVDDNTIALQAAGYVTTLQNMNELRFLDKTVLFENAVITDKPALTTEHPPHFDAIRSSLVNQYSTELQLLSFDAAEILAELNQSGPFLINTTDSARPLPIEQGHFPLGVLPADTLILGEISYRWSELTSAFGEIENLKFTGTDQNDVLIWDTGSGFFENVWSGGDDLSIIGTETYNRMLLHPATDGVSIATKNVETTYSDSYGVHYVYRDESGSGSVSISEHFNRILLPHESNDEIIGGSEATNYFFPGGNDYVEGGGGNDSFDVWGLNGTLTIGDYEGSASGAERIIFTQNDYYISSVDDFVSNQTFINDEPVTYLGLNTPSFNDAQLVKLYGHWDVTSISISTDWFENAERLSIYLRPFSSEDGISWRGENFGGVAWNDFANGGVGNDVFRGLDGSDTLHGGDGNDRILGGQGNDSLSGGDGRDTLYGGDGDDILDGSSGTAATQGPGDYIRAGLGNDTIIGHQEHFNDGGEGAVISYGDITGLGGVKITVTDNATGSGTVVSRSGTTIGDNFSYVRFFQGSADADIIQGGVTSQTGFAGLGGNDTLYGGESEYDILQYNDDHYEEGGDGAVTVNFATGIAIDGFGDTDTFFNMEQVRGTAKGDTFIGSANNERMLAMGGNDSLIGALGNDTLDGGSGNDLLIGDDALTAYTFNAILTKNDENWTATSLERVDLTLYLEQEQPFTYSYGDPYSFPGGRVVQMLVNNGTLYDHISFNGYNDSFQANTPLISQFTTKSGENYIILEIPFEMDGVKQNLLFELYSEGSHFDSVQTLDDWFSDAQRKSQGIPAIPNYQAGASLSLADSTPGQLIDGSNLTGKLGGNDSLVGGDGDDTIIGGPGHDSLLGGAGNDLLNDGLGNDTIDGGDGIDTYTRNFSEETDYIWKVGIDLENGYIFHAETNEIGDPLLNIENLYLPGSLDKKIVGSGVDNEILTGAGNDTINAGGGDDTISGGGGNDTIDAGAGVDDVLYDGARSDYVLSQLGTDVFVTSNLDGSVDTLRNVEFLSFSGDGARITIDEALTGTPGSGSVLSGQVYQWSSHYLLPDVSITGGAQSSTFSGTETDPRFKITNIRIIDGVVKADVVLDAKTELVENFTLNLLFDDSITAELTANSDLQASGWQTLSSNIEGGVSLGGFALIASFTGEKTIAELTLSGSVDSSNILFTISDSAIGTSDAETMVADYEVRSTVFQASTTQTGDYNLSGALDVSTPLIVTKSLAATDEGRVISAADALAALKIAVGLNPNLNSSGEGFATSSYQYLAADVNEDGRVSAADALAILKMAVKLDGAPEREWVFLREDADIMNPDGTSSFSRSSVDWSETDTAISTGDTEVNFVGLLKGDVNGSWSDDSLTQLDGSYFDGFANADQWWVV